MFQQLYGFQSAPFARTLTTNDVLATPCVKAEGPLGNCTPA